MGQVLPNPNPIIDRAVRIQAINVRSAARIVRMVERSVVDSALLGRWVSEPAVTA